LGSVRQTLARLDPNITILAWLGSVNVGLGLFNLIPGVPLDGGRVLRSILWAITHNLRLATQWASWAGRGISWLMIFGGVAITFGARIPVLGQGFANGIWLAIIGWFLHNAAVQSYQQMIIREALEDVPVSRLMQRDPPTVSSERTVANFVHDYVMQSNDHGFPVIEDGRLVGLATLEDVRSVPRPLWDITYVRQIMTPLEQLALTPEDNASRALEVLVSRDVRQLPVIRGDHLEGVLRRRDIVGWLQLQTRTSSSQNVVSL
jgi:CBS domain-containing protein